MEQLKSHSRAGRHKCQLYFTYLRVLFVLCNYNSLIGLPTLPSPSSAGLLKLPIIAVIIQCYMAGAAINIATATLNQFHPFVCRSCITIQEKSWYLCTLSVRRFVFYLTVSALARFWQFLVRSFVSPSVILSLLCFSCFLEYRSEEKRAELPPNAKKTTSVGTIIFVKYQVSTTRIDEIIFKNKQWYISSFQPLLASD